MSAAVVGLATAEDVPALAALEALSNPHPWSAAQLEEELRHPQGSVALVRVGATVAAYLSTRLVLDEWHILNVATHPAHRRQGLGRLLLRHGAQAARERGATTALLEVRAGNTGALALYTGLGFARVGLRRGYYAPNGEDAVLMTAPLSGVLGA